MPSSPLSTRNPPAAAHDFVLRVDVASGTVRVGGEADLETAPVLRSVIAVLAEGGADVVLDLADLDFMDASGLRVIVDAAESLRAHGAVLSLRAPSPLLRRILHLTRVAELVRLGERDAEIEPPPEHEPNDRPAGAATRLAADLARGGSRTPHEAVDAELRLVTLLTSATIGGAEGVSVTLERRGSPCTVASSNETVLRMDQHQYETGEGPCLSAAAEGRSFLVDSLADETRWPAFVPRALAEGIGGILSTPLLDADGAMGALNIYSSRAGAFGPHEQELAALFATQASGIVAHASPEPHDERMATQIFDALAARQIIAQAQGVIMARHHVTPEAAAGLLHRTARTAELGVLQLATQMVGSMATSGSVLADEEAS